MPDKRRTHCMICDRHASEVGPISWRGKCHGCGKARQSIALDQLDAHRGPVFDHWRQRTAASVGAVILDGAGVQP